MFLKISFFAENPFAKALQNFCIIITQAYYRQSYLRVIKHQSFWLEILFHLFTCQSITLHCDTNNTQRQIEQIQTTNHCETCCWEATAPSALVTPHPLLCSYFRPFPVGVLFAGKLLVYTSWVKIRDKGRSQPVRAKVGTRIAVCYNGMHICTPLHMRVPFSLFPIPVTSLELSAPSGIDGEFCRWLIEINGSFSSGKVWKGTEKALPLPRELIAICDSPSVYRLLSIIIVLIKASRADWQNSIPRH